MTRRQRHLPSGPQNFVTEAPKDYLSPPGETPEEREQRHALNKEKAAMLKRQAEPRHRWENSKFTLTNTDDERLPPYRTYPCMQTVYLCILTVAVVLVLL